MKARLLKEFEDLAIGNVYTVHIYGGDMELIGFRAEDIDGKWDIDLCTQYKNIEEILVDWELLQPVSDTTKQHLLEKLEEELCWWEEIDEYTTEQQGGEQLEKVLEIVCSVLEGKE